MQQLMNVRTDLLLKLADFLDGVPATHFNLLDWQVPSRDCGFAGCAMGWAAHAKLFEGLTIGYSEIYYECAKSEADIFPPRIFGWAAVRKLFGLEQEHTTANIGMDSYLFGSWRYEMDEVSPAIVAARIRKVVKKIESRIARHKAKATLIELQQQIDWRPVRAWAALPVAAG